MLEKGIISEEQLNKAIEQQKITGQKLGEVLTGWESGPARSVRLSVCCAVSAICVWQRQWQQHCLDQAFASPAPGDSGDLDPDNHSRGEGLHGEDEMGDISAQGSPLSRSVVESGAAAQGMVTAWKGSGCGQIAQPGVADVDSETSL